MKIPTLRSLAAASSIAILTSCVSVPVTTHNPQERQIFLQAVATGVTVGAAAGAAIGNQSDNTLGGALIGAAVGGLIGMAVAEEQLKTLRNLKLGNQQLEALLTSAESYNDEIATYNKNLGLEIARLNKEAKALKREGRAAPTDFVATQLSDAEARRQGVRKQIQEREQLAQVLEPGQRKQYEQKLKDLRRQERNLDASIARMQEIHEQTRVG